MDNYVGNLSKATRLLRALATNGSSGASVANLARACDIPRPSAHRVLAKLEQVGWVQKSESNRRLYLGPELAVLGFAALQRFPLESLAQPFMEDLSEKTGQTISLMRKMGDEAVCVGRVEGSGHIRALLLEVGSRWPLGKGAAGMAILAALPEDEADIILVRNEAKIETENLQALRQRLKESRKTGYSKHQGLVLPGVCGMAAPIYDTSGQVIASVSVAFVEDWMDSDELAACVSGIPELANLISKRLSDGS